MRPARPSPLSERVDSSGLSPAHADGRLDRRPGRRQWTPWLSAVSQHESGSATFHAIMWPQGHYSGREGSAGHLRPGGSSGSLANEYANSH